MKKFFLLSVIFLLFNNFVLSQSISGRISSSFYTFERFESKDISAKYVHNYENLYLNISKGNFSLRTNIFFETELSQKMVDNNKLRFYNLYLEARNLFDIVSFKIGRQPVYSAAIGGIFDGASLEARYSLFKLSGFIGGNVPAYQQLKLTENLKENYVLGGKLSARLFDELDLAVGYFQKNSRPEPFYAKRVDENFDLITYLIQLKSTQFKFGTLDLGYEYSELYQGNLKFEYDFNFKELSKVELFSRLSPTKDLGVEIYSTYRAPLIRYNSIFAVFDYGNTYEVEIGADYKLTPHFSFNARGGVVNFKDDNASRISFGLNTSYGSLNYRKTFGYAGELDAVSLYAAHSFFEGMITPSCGLAFTSYKLSPSESEKNSLVTLLAGLNYRPFKSFSVDIQGQYMNNTIYKDDMRFFLKLNYWFNTNLKLI